MYVNIEFLGGEPVENVVICMPVKIDKTILWGIQKLSLNKRVE